MIGMALAMTTMAMNPVDLGWLAGYWLSCDSAKEVSETWSDMRAGVSFGTSITFHGGQLSWEYARIGPSKTGFSFYAQPNGQPAAEFPLVRRGPNEVVFENPRHDFPQRIIYRRTGNMLLGRIEGVVNGKPRAQEWRYKAAPLNSRCWSKPPARPSGKKIQPIN